MLDFDLVPTSAWYNSYRMLMHDVFDSLPDTLCSTYVQYDDGWVEMLSGSTKFRGIRVFS